MAQVQQVPSSPMNGIPEKNGNGLSIEESASTAVAALAHIQNGAVLFHGTPTKDLNGASTSIDTDDLQLSPSDLRRRSTRASALKAQEKIKLKDDIVQGPQKRANDDDDMEDEELGDEINEQSAPKKRRLENGKEFDQTCFRFGLRANNEGEVYAMTDESENSSIHESEMEVVRYHYEKMKNKEPDEEQLRERLNMRREAENQLREEEAKLLVLRKMKDSQTRAITKLAAETKAADLAEATSAAYKPAVATNGKSVTNGKNSMIESNNKTMNGLKNLSIPQQLELLQKLSSQSPAAKQAYIMAKKNPAQTTQLFQQLITINNQNLQKQKELSAAETNASASASPAVQQSQQAQQPQQAQITQSKLLNQQTPAQRIQAARLAFRAQADKQLTTIPTQKSQPHDITFLPNPNASAFLALHGLDLVVQHVLKDRSNETPYAGPSYECEECKTECAHTWKAIGSTQDDLHLYCENCVRSAQKRKNRTDQTALLKRAFQKITAQEKEFEKKIAEGQLEQYAEAKAAAPATSQTIPTSSTATVSSIPLVPRLPQIPSSTGSSTPTQAVKTSTPIHSTPKSSSSSAKKTAAQLQQQSMQGMNQLFSTAMLRNNPQMQQMLQMYQALAMGGGAANMANNQMAMLFQAQAMQAAQAQVARAQAAKAQAAQAQAAQAQAQAQANREANQQSMLIQALMSNGQVNVQALQQLQKLTPEQQKALIEVVKRQTRK
ncbi:Transcription factor dcp-66 [Caenorhabditis elegans]|uniref:Isoform a of Transcription factor dcp-66 n=1 Tax=Caenorhabditis elegans TaxID=6239 RepID=G5ED89-2|nr:Transcription factor dcp-66 [Caenorhabditis elegans]CAA96601.3 Transcription factor dcp-66 [Caenorhabditis elegans]|eukprot:NP_492111.3 Deacetylase Complex Protein [Caenorhabditis elegans]